MLAECLILHYDLSCSKVAVILMDVQGQVKTDEQGCALEMSIGNRYAFTNVINRHYSDH